MASTSSSMMDLLEAECPDIAGRRKRRRRRNKHVNPQSQRNLVRPPPPPPRCSFRQPSLIDPDSWVVLVRLNDEEALHEFDEKLPLIAPKAGVNEAILKSHGFMRLIYVPEEEDIKAKSLANMLAAYSAVFIGRTHKPFVRERTLEVHNLPPGIGYHEVTEALDCQFPGKTLSFDVLITEDPRREPEREVLIVTHDTGICHQLLNNGGLKLFDERLTFRCTERSSDAAADARKWKKKKAKIVPESERQCFKCLAFGHMAEHCDAPPRCKRCAGPHTHRECPGDAVDKVECVNCGATGHRAVSRSCPLRPGSSQKRRKEVATQAAAAVAAGEASAPEGSTSPSPSDTGAEDSPEPCSCPEGAKEEKEPVEEGGGGEREGSSPPNEIQQNATESRSEDDVEDLPVEASTEELRDSSVMASPAATASPRDDTAEPNFQVRGATESAAGGEDEAVDECKDETAQAECTESAAEDKEETEITEKNIEKEENHEDDEEAEVKEEVKISNTGDDEVKQEVDETAEKQTPEARGSTDESEEEAEKHLDEDVLYFTGDKEGDLSHCKTASAVASFFSDLFGAAEAPSKPLDTRFVATLRSLQESVYADIVARHPRRGPSSPRERKPAKKRRLLGSVGSDSREAHTQTVGAGQLPRSSAASPVSKGLGSSLGRLRVAAEANGANKASRGLAERRLRVLEQFLNVVNAILEI